MNKIKKVNLARKNLMMNHNLFENYNPIVNLKEEAKLEDENSMEEFDDGKFVITDRSTRINEENLKRVTSFMVPDNVRSCSLMDIPEMSYG